jgi:hypothetical protein
MGWMHARLRLFRSAYPAASNRGKVRVEQDGAKKTEDRKAYNGLQAEMQEPLFIGNCS